MFVKPTFKFEKDHKCKMQCGKWFLILINFLVALLGVAIMIFAGVGYGRLTDYSDLCKDCSAAVAVLIICLGGLVRIKNISLEKFF